ncbi:MAG: diguanylate cyclase [Lachnospiraceae bacterium]|nr:diguanylate cyclase [Lachnospiraceae bacterium]
MKQKKQITTKTFVLTAAIGSLLITAMVIINTFWSAKQTGDATDDAVSAVSSFYLETMADSHAKTITSLISNSFDEMAIAVAYIEDEDIHSQEELREIIGRLESLLGMNQFALVDENNVVYTRYTTYTGRSRHAFLSQESLDDRVISIGTLYGSSRQLCLAIPTPGLSIMGKNYKVCFVQFDIDYIADMLADDNQGRTHFSLYSKSGSNISGTPLGPVISNQNFFGAIEGLVSEEVWNKNRENFEKGKEGSLTFSSDGANETLSYVPIEGTDWVAAVLIRESVIQDQIRDVSERNLETSRNQIIFTLVSVLVLATILLLQFSKLSNEKLEEEKKTSRNFRNMANTDSMTGVKNKHAYSEEEAYINNSIEKGDFQKLAVVVGDINGLKYVNDNFGHAAGDQLIMDACNLICEFFTHDEVFRVGGDEFVAILRGENFDRMQEAITELNRRVEANIKEKAVVIAIGYSILEQEDQHLSDVFERADRMMYERKKELKAMGTPTGR